MEDIKKNTNASLTEEDIHKIAENNRENVIIDTYQRGILHLHNYDAVRKYKSVRRAIRRGLVSVFGDIYPKRPYNNRKSFGGTGFIKRKIYEQLKGRNKPLS